MLLTFCAPAERENRDALLAARQAFLANDLAVAMFNAIPEYAVVINHCRQIIAANSSFLQVLSLSSIEPLLGLRPGESVGCVYAADAPGGCGTGSYCIHCGGVDAMVECLRTQQPVTRECRVITHGDADGGALDLEVHATFYRVDAHELVVLVMRDVRDEKRRRVLERVFFHDVLNTASSLSIASQLMIEAEELGNEQLSRKLTQSSFRLSKRIMEEITAQEQLLAAEQGHLQLHLTEVTVAELLHEVCAYYREQEPAWHCSVQIGIYPDCTLVTDPVLVQHVLNKLLKNAMEATAACDTVTLSARASETTIAFDVHNQGVMPDAVQRQLFQRSFSTKAETGRGIGTYSAKLITERFLGGRARVFQSTAGWDHLHHHPSTSSLAIGRVNAKVLPLPTSLSTRMRPPCASTRRLVINNPNPVPSALRMRSTR